MKPATSRAAGSEPRKKKPARVDRPRLRGNETPPSCTLAQLAARSGARVLYATNGTAPIGTIVDFPGQRRAVAFDAEDRLIGEFADRKLALRGLSDARRAA